MKTPANNNWINIYASLALGVLTDSPDEAREIALFIYEQIDPSIDDPKHQFEVDITYWQE